MMGAIYLDQGYNFVNRLLINSIYATALSLDRVDEEETDFKSRLIEWGQKHHHQIVFKTKGIGKGSSAGAHSFRSTVMIDDLEAGHGMGESKKEAEQAAAQSVANEMNDELCARLLDKLDRLEATTPKKVS